MEWSNIIVLSSSFFVLLFIGVPISFSIGIASLLTIMLSIPFDAAIAVISQKMASGLDSFSLLAIPFFHPSWQYYESWRHCDATN